MDEKKKFKIVTLGCRTNQYESQAYADQLIQLGYVQAKEGEEADVCIVNTCSVTASADSASRHQIRALVKEHPLAQLVVTGCSASREPQHMASLEGVSLVVPNQSKEKLINLALSREEVPEFAIRQFEAHTRAFVKVQDGCNSFCSYCIIPYVRGRSRSRKVGDILREIRVLIQNGYKEVVLTGINVGDFDGKPEEGQNSSRLSDLVKEVDALDGLKRLRISSIDPDEVDEALLQAVVQGKTTCPSMHIALQSGSDAILKKMNRKYTVSVFLRTVERLRKARPDFTITTDVIVGFPGESERDFQETLDVMQEVRFAKVHMFPFSPRKGTKAALFPHPVSQEVLDERRERLLKLAKEHAHALRESYVGQKREVLFENGMIGHTDNFLPVLVKDKEPLVNEIREVELITNTDETLVGRVGNRQQE